MNNIRYSFIAVVFFCVFIMKNAYAVTQNTTTNNVDEDILIHFEAGTFEEKALRRLAERIKYCTHKAADDNNSSIAFFSDTSLESATGKKYVDCVNLHGNENEAEWVVFQSLEKSRIDNHLAFDMLYPEIDAFQMAIRKFRLKNNKITTIGDLNRAAIRMLKKN